MDNKEIIEDAEIVKVYDDETSSSEVPNNPYDNINMDDFKLSDEQLHTLMSKDSDETITIEDMNQLIVSMRDMIGVVEQMWINYKKSYNITDEHLKALAAFNAEHCEPKVDDSEEKYDYFNGLNKLTSEDIVKIFGEDSIIGSEADEKTIKLIKDIVDSYFSWLSGSKQFQQLNNTYTNLIEENEQAKMDELKKIADAETDPSKKEMMLKAYNEYYSLKYLDFLKEPINEFRMSIMNQQFINAEKINYLIERTKEKLEEMKFSSMFVLELSNFETRFLDSKYKDQNNILLLWFLNQVVYGDLKDSKKKDRVIVVSFVLAMDRLIRKQWNEEITTRIMNNIIALEDQFTESITKTLADFKAKENK